MGEIPAPPEVLPYYHSRVADVKLPSRSRSSIGPTSSSWASSSIQQTGQKQILIRPRQESCSPSRHMEHIQSARGGSEVGRERVRPTMFTEVNPANVFMLQHSFVSWVYLEGELSNETERPIRIHGPER